MGLVWALIRAGRTKLSCARCITSSDGDLLYGSGASEHIITSWFSQGILWGVSKVMRHYIETGKARYDEWSHLAMGMRFRAARELLEQQGFKPGKIRYTFDRDRDGGLVLDQKPSGGTPAAAGTVVDLTINED